MGPALKMKDLTHQRNLSDTAPSTDDTGHDTKSVCTDKERSSLDVSQVQPPISCLSMKSDFSRGQPPLFSCDPPGNEWESPNSSDDLHKVNDIRQTPGRLIKVQPPVEQSEDAALELYQRKLKFALKHRYKRRIKNMTRVSLREGQDQAVTTQSPPESSMDLSELFRSASVRTVLTSGAPGVGKSVLVQRSIVDWCEDRALQHVQLLCPLPVPQLHLLQQQSWTLMELLQTFCPGLRESGLRDLSHCRLLFILDGLDECRLPLDFSTEHRCCDAEAAVPVDALLTNLMEGNLLPQAQLWIICRPAAARSIPSTLIHRTTEVRGFSRRQKEAYFLQNLQDEAQARTVVARVGSCAALHHMCRLPLFCSVTASACARSSSTSHMFLLFLWHHMRNMQLRYGLQRSRASTVVQALSKLAHQQLQSGELLFWEQELTACGVEVTEALVYSGLCSQVFTEERCGGHWAFSFLHLSLQQFLAALFLRTSFRDRDHLHQDLRDQPVVQQFLLELSLESSVSMLLHINI